MGRTQQQTARNASELDHVIARRLRELRLQKQVSQDAIGKVLGVSFQQIQKYERGVNRISAARLFAISAMLGVPMSDFFEETKDDQPLTNTRLRTGRPPLSQ